jgi:hypothetical protein
MTADLLYKRIDELTKQSRVQAKRIRRLVRERDELHKILDRSLHWPEPNLSWGGHQARTAALLKKWEEEAEKKGTK